MPRFLINGHLIYEAGVIAHGKDAEEAEANAEKGQYEVGRKAGDPIFAVGNDAPINLDAPRENANHRQPK